MNANQSVTATFTSSLPPVTLTVVLAGTGFGGVTSVPAGINCSQASPDCTEPYPVGTPVVLTATAPVWVRVSEGGQRIFEGEMAVGQSFQVPATATAPTLTAGKPEALRITVGSAVAPAVGPAGQVASNVSLAPADLMRGGNAPEATAPAPTIPQ